MILQPDLGLFFWSSIIWLFAVVVLRKFAWTPLLKFIEQQEQKYMQAHLSAFKAQKRLTGTQVQAEKILAQAKERSQQMEKVAKATKASILFEAKVEAKQQKFALVEKAKQAIAQERAKANKEIQEQVALLSLQVAEQVLQHEINKKEIGQAYLNRAIAAAKKHLFTNETKR